MTGYDSYAMSHQKVALLKDGSICLYCDDLDDDDDTYY
jgi:hypothetical protein